MFFGSLTLTGRNDIISDGLISQLAIALDSITPATMVFVIAATNRPEKLEPALLRPGASIAFFFFQGGLRH